jgi:hypothetical protein
MTKEHEIELKNEIAHIFDSGANEIRIFEMVKMFLDRRDKAINYTLCCTELKGKEALTFEEFKKDNFIKKDGVYRWKTETKNRWFGEDYVRYAYSL